MKRFTTLAHSALIAATLFGATAAFADPIPFNSALVATDQTQLGRLSRDSNPSEGTPNKPFGAIINPTVAYHFHAYAVDVGADGYVVIEFDETSANIFASAYQSNYYSSNPATTYLGDAGFSGYYQTNDPNSFAFTATPFSTVIVVVNETTANGGLGATSNGFTLSAQSFVDSAYDDYPGIDLAFRNGSGYVIPEPSTLLLLAPLALVAGLKSRRRRPASAALLAA
jgi:hypothetical protein